MVGPTNNLLAMEIDRFAASENNTKVAVTKSRALQDMAKDFEAMFLSQILKEMRQTLEPESLFAGDQGDIQGGLFDLFLGKHLADAGGIGLARFIQQQLDPKQSRELSSHVSTSENRSSLFG